MKIGRDKSGTAGEAKGKSKPKGKGPEVLKAMYLQCEIGQQKVMFRVTPDGAEKVDAAEIPAGTGVIRFDESDHRLVLPAKRAKSQKEVKAACMNLIKTMPVYRAGAKPGVFYVAKDGREWLDKRRGLRAIPGPAIVDAALDGNADLGEPTVIGVHLDIEPYVLVLYALHDGELDGPKLHIRANAEQVPDLIHEYVDELGLPEEAGAAVLEPADLLKLMVGKGYRGLYPAKTEWHGIPKTKVTAFIVALTAGWGAVAAGMWLTLSARAAAVERQIEQVGDTSQITARVREEIESHITGYARLRSVDIAGGLHAAAQLWRPGMHVSLAESRATGDQIEVWPAKDSTAANMALDEGQQIRVLSNLSAPKGWHKSQEKIESNGSDFTDEFTRREHR